MSSLPATEHLTLANGLRVVLCHAPRLKRCAASLRLAAGSHDVPAEYPGLAHFLEHLLFLGTERFADDEKLMTFVQRHGGQVNASTRERSTDFFFELPKAVFADGLARLWDMLAHPRMSLADQLREREVLHAEFIAWWPAAATVCRPVAAPSAARLPCR
jgi:secreted Zn-dependent insulinase-like peptidase